MGSFILDSWIFQRITSLWSCHEWRWLSYYDIQEQTTQPLCTFFGFLEILRTAANLAISIQVSSFFFQGIYIFSFCIHGTEAYVWKPLDCHLVVAMAIGLGQSVSESSHLFWCHNSHCFLRYFRTVVFKSNLLLYYCCVMLLKVKTVGLFYGKWKQDLVKVSVVFWLIVCFCVYLLPICRFSGCHTLWAFFCSEKCLRIQYFRRQNVRCNVLGLLFLTWLRLHLVLRVLLCRLVEHPYAWPCSILLFSLSVLCYVCKGVSKVYCADKTETRCLNVGR